MLRLVWLGNELFNVSEPYAFIKINDMHPTTYTNVQERDSNSSPVKINFQQQSVFSYVSNKLDKKYKLLKY
jgi:hypothetical protein